MRKSSILILLLLVTSLTLCLSTNKAYAYNNEESDIGVLSENINSLEVEPIVIEPFGDKKDDNVTAITPSNQSDFTDMKYISNSNYFLINPRHVPSNKFDNSKYPCINSRLCILQLYQKTTLVFQSGFLVL